MKVKYIVKSIKGYIKPGHKYIRRTGTQGKYRYLYSDIGKLSAPKTIKKKVSGSTINEILRALKYLSSRCDYASSIDGVGFNKFDAEFGHNLASKDSLSDKQAESALKMLRKYKGQLEGGGIKLDYGTRFREPEIKSDVDADILLTSYDKDRYAILFDFNWNDPKWKELKDSVKSSGARYDGNKRLWYIDDDHLSNLFDNVKKVAITEQAKKMIENRKLREGKRKIEKQKKLEKELIEAKKGIERRKKGEEKNNVGI